MIQAALILFITATSLSFLQIHHIEKGTFHSVNLNEMIPDFHINRTWFLHFLLYFIFFKYVSSFYFLFPIPVIKCYQFFFSAIPIHISQTLCFSNYDGETTEYAKKAIVQEYEKYKAKLKKNGTKYKILSEKTNEDGSIVIEVKKQYNSSPVGEYLN